MSFEVNVFSISLLMSGITALLLALIVFQRMGDYARWFSLMILASAVWAIAYALELSSDNLNQMLFWINFEYIGVTMIPATWIIFAIKFIGKNEWLSARNKLLIFTFPVATLLFVWTNHWHHIHYENVHVVTTGPFPMLAITPCTWYYVFTVYFYFQLALGVGLLLYTFRRADTVYKLQIRIIIIAMVVPWLCNFIYLVGGRPFHYIDATPYAFIITTIAIGIGLLRFKLLEVVPVAHGIVIEQMLEGMIVLDKGQRVVDINPAMKKFLAHTDADFIGQRFDVMLPTTYSLHQFINRQKAGKMEWVMNNSQEDRIYEVTLTPLLNGSQLDGILLTFWDITERIDTEKKLKDQAQELRGINQLKDRLLSIIAHDVRAPIASLKGILEIVENGNLSEKEFKTYVSLLSKNVGYTSSLLDNMLVWARSQMKGQTIKTEHFDLKDISTEVIRLFGERFNRKSIHVQDDVAPGTMLHSDKNMITMVVRNLVSNSIKFCNEGDRIILQAEPGEEFTRVTIIDTGIGMDKPTLEKVFALDIVSTRGTNNEQGTGLGLKLCKDFIEQNEGEIWVESYPGKGTTFYFKLKTGRPINNNHVAIKDVENNVKLT